MSAIAPDPFSLLPTSNRDFDHYISQRRPDTRFTKRWFEGLTIQQALETTLPHILPPGSTVITQFTSIEPDTVESTEINQQGLEDLPPYEDLKLELANNKLLEAFNRGARSVILQKRDANGVAGKPVLFHFCKVRVPSPSPRASPDVFST